MQNIRNFAIIAHVDHGKSTLADRMLEITKTVEHRLMQNQLLDSNPIERERGITIKLAPVRMKYLTLDPSPNLGEGSRRQGEVYILNLIDTPGHVDFSYEVNRSLAACEGAILVVDATQGVQAQTLSHFNQAKKLGLVVIPAINKIDINIAEVENTKKQLTDLLGFAESDLYYISAKTGAGVPELLQAIIEKIPSPNTEYRLPNTRALVFNSNFDSHLGAIAWVRVIDEQIKVRDRIKLLATNAETVAVEVGVFIPGRHDTGILEAGEVGYVVTGLKDLSLLTVGDTLTLSGQHPAALPGYKPIKPVVFVGLYPVDGSQINTLREGLEKLKLSDSALTYVPEFSPALGNGFRVGLLGLLHADIVQERLEREFDLNLIASAPSVSYEVELADKKIIQISRASDLPDPSLINQIREPIIKLSIFVPEEYVGAVMQLCQNYRSEMLDMVYLNKLVNLTYKMPFSELVRQFFDNLKSVSSGYATLDYEIIGFEASDLVRLDVLIAGDKVDAFSQIVPRERAVYIARDLVERLEKIIPRQQYEIIIQAAIGSKILARADIKPFRKDVIAKLSGGDQTRKDKLLKKQKKGKARMKRVGRIDIPQEAFLSILKA